jgi:hypothetical protein
MKTRTDQRPRGSIFLTEPTARMRPDFDPSRSFVRFTHVCASVNRCTYTERPANDWPAVT